MNQVDIAASVAASVTGLSSNATGASWALTAAGGVTLTGHQE